MTSLGDMKDVWSLLFNLRSFGYVKEGDYCWRR